MKGRSVYIVSEYIEYFFLTHPVSKKEFCEECEISLETLEKAKMGCLDITVEDMAKIAEYIEVPIERLIIDLNLDRFKNSDKYLWRRG